MSARPRFMATTGLLVWAAGCQVLAGLDGELTSSQPAEPARRDADAPLADADLDVLATPDATSPTDEYAKLVLADGPVAYYRFAETTGLRCADSTGNANDVFVSPAAVRGRPSVIVNGDPSVGLSTGVAATFTLPSKFDFSPSQPFTYELWYRPALPLDATGTAGNLLSNIVGGAGGPDRGTVLYLDDGFPYVGFERWSGGPPPFALAHQSSPTQLTDSGVVHVVVVNTGAGDPVLYVNTVRTLGSRNAPGAVAPAAIIVGERPGDYDEIAIYDKALTSDVVNRHFARGAVP